MKLKTLKDIITDELIREALKAEAIKWVEGLLYLEKNKLEHKPSQEFMHFFNITKLDLKSCKEVKDDES